MTSVWRELLGSSEGSNTAGMIYIAVSPGSKSAQTLSLGTVLKEVLHCDTCVIYVPHVLFLPLADNFIIYFCLL